MSSTPYTFADRLNRYGDGLGQFAFVIFLVLGGAVIFGFDWLGITKQWAVTVCSLLIVAYAVAAFRLPALRGRVDQIADNVYYLGLLYTLASLAVAIVALANIDQATEIILRNFGIAIFTTIVGMAGRVVIMQLRGDPVDVERETRASLIEMARTFRGELDQSVSEFKNFRIASKQALDESAASAAEELTNALANAITRFEEATTDITERLEESHALFSDQAKTLRTSSSRLVTSMEKLAERVENVEFNEEVLRNAITPALKSVEEAATESSTRIREASVSLSERIDAIKINPEALTQSFDRALKPLEGAIDQQCERLSDRVAQIVNALSELESLSNDAEKFSKASSALGTAADSIASGATKLDALVKSTQSAGDQIVQFGERVEATGSSLDKIGALPEKLDDIIRRHESLVERLSRSGDQFSDTLEKDMASIARVRDELADLSDYIVKRLEA